MAEIKNQTNAQNKKETGRAKLKLRNPITSSVRNKLILITVLITVLAVLIVGGYAVWVSTTALSANAEREEVAGLDIYARGVTNFLSGLEQDVIFLGNSQSLAEYLDAKHGGADESLTTQKRVSAEKEFLAFAQARGIYDQVRFIDANGQEVVRVNTNASGVSSIVLQDGLQNKANRYYFVDTIALPPGKVFISPLDLNIEHGEIEILPDGAYKPVIRYGVPVVYNGKVVGVIVTNILAKYFLDSLREGDKHIYLADKDGYYLSHPNPDRAWGRDLGTGITLFSEYSPEIAQTLLSNKSGAFTQGDDFFAHLPVTLPGHPEISWYLGEALPREAVFAPVRSFVYGAAAITLLVAVLAVIAAVAMDRAITAPIIELGAAALRVSKGDFNVNVPQRSKDEIGVLAEAFNIMAEQIRELVGDLKRRVASRTRQLEVVVGVSQRFSSILDMDTLMREVVTVTKEAFNYYHAHIYLLNEAGDTLVMAEGYGQAGAEMKGRGHSIPLAAKSLVARAARQKSAVIVENVHNDPDWLPNPLLPHTQSELAIPVMLEREVVGVLDVQSEKISGLTIGDEIALRILANQIAIAARNARLFAKTQGALEQVQQTQNLYTERAWEGVVATRNKTMYEFHKPLLSPLEVIDDSEIETALQQKQTVHLKSSNGDDDADGTNDQSVPYTALATPLKLGGQIIGVLGLRDEDFDRRWTEDEIALIEAVGEQMSLALENARLFEDTQRNAWRDRVVSETTAQIWSSVEIEDVMKAAVAQLGEKLKASEVVIQLGTGQDV